MTDQTQNADPDRQPAALSPYEPPSVLYLGRVRAVTAGPIKDGGNMDALVGLTGGFNATSSPVS